MAADKMNTDERYKLVRCLRAQYHAADRKGKARLLDSLQMTTRLHRKHLIALLHDPDLRRHPRNRERSRVYGPDVELVVAIVADTLDWIGAERLQPALVSTAQHLERFGHLTLNPALCAQLQQISIATVRRMLVRIGRPVGALPQVRRGRRSDSVAQALVPVGVIPWDQPEPGHFEADLVLHNSANSEGPFVCSLQLIDVLTGWSERFAVMGYEFDEMWRAVQAFRLHCPFAVREVHTDNGTEFMNLAFISHFGRDAVHGQLTRGRPGCKNDNRFVEQKNSSLIRAYLGHLYLHTPTHRDLLDRIYQNMWCYYNLFQPVVRQTSRRAETSANGLVRIVRTQDTAATPLERLLRAKPPLLREKAEYLQALHDATDPLALKRRIHRQVGELARLAQSEGQREAVVFR